MLNETILELLGVGYGRKKVSLSLNRIHYDGCLGTVLNWRLIFSKVDQHGKVGTVIPSVHPTAGQYFTVIGISPNLFYANL